MGHYDGAVSIFTRRWLTSLPALQDLKTNVCKLTSSKTKKQKKTKLTIHVQQMAHHAENGVRATAPLVHFCLPTMSVFYEKKMNKRIARMDQKSDKIEADYIPQSC